MAAYTDITLQHEPHTIYYRFKCDRCGKTTDWFSYDIHGNSTMRLYGNNKATPEDVAAIHQSAEKDIQKKLDSMKNNISKGCYFESPLREKEASYLFEDKCPFCKTAQKGQHRLIYPIFMWGLLFSAPPMFAVSIAGDSAVVLALILFLIGTGFGVYRNIKKYKNRNVTVPEYNWNGR